MKNVTRILCLLFIVCVHSVVSQAAVGDDYLVGWDANGSTTATPYDAGWRSTDGNIAWASSNPIDANKYQYRDNLGIGRAFIHPQNHSVFSFPLKNLVAKKFYQFSCVSAKMSGNNTRPTTFAVNSAADGSGTILGSDTKAATKWDSRTNHSFKFMPLIDGEYYLTWKTEASDGDRSLAYDFKAVEIGDALTVTFNTDGGSEMASQYLLAGADEKVVKPAIDPVKAGYIFKGWYADAALTTVYDFEMPVTKDITISAKWEDTKEELKKLIVTANSLLTEGTEIGIAYLQGMINNANLIVENDAATVEEITTAFNNLTEAIGIYKDASLTNLFIDGAAVTGFSATAYQYSYSFASGTTNIPVIMGNAKAECAVVSVSPANQLPGSTTVVVTAGNGTTQTYTVNFIINYMFGWDANGITPATPGDAGWLSTNTASWDVVNSMLHCYRDNITYNSFAGRTLTTDYGQYVYAYPVELAGGKLYRFTGRLGAINGGANPASFNVDFNTTTSRVDGTSLVTRTYSITQSTLNTYSDVSFFAPATGTYYFTFEGTTGCRGLLSNLTLVELPAISSTNLSTFSDGALANVEHLVLTGDFTAANLTALAAKLGNNVALTTVDLTDATIKNDALDIFAALNANSLKYFAVDAAVPANWTNAVVGDVAEEIILVDGASFNNTKPFSATTISYKRTFAEGWSTFCLPFPMTDINGLGTIEEFKEVKETAGIIAFETATMIESGNPYLINVENEALKTFLATGVEVPVTVAVTGIFNATFRKLTETDAEGKLILVDEGDIQKFKTATAEATIPAFRAYISLPGASDEVRSYTISHDDGAATGMENAASDGQKLSIYSSVRGTVVMEAAETQQVILRSVDGRLLRTITLNAGENVTINLAMGIYLFNNQKVVVK